MTRISKSLADFIESEANSVPHLVAEHEEAMRAAEMHYIQRQILAAREKAIATLRAEHNGEVTRPHPARMFNKQMKARADEQAARAAELLRSEIDAKTAQNNWHTTRKAKSHVRNLLKGGT